MVTRTLVLAATVAALSGTGCASTWDTVSSRRFRDAPFGTMFGRDDDALAVLRTSPVGDERARAMARLKEPAAGPDRDEAVKLLATAASTDPSPWVRLTAVDALGRFTDPRAADALIAAYQAAPGKPAVMADGLPPFQTASQRSPITRNVADLRGPQGFPPDQVAGLRVRILDAVGKHGQPAGVDLLARVAEGGDGDDSDPVARDSVRQAAVRNLGTVKEPKAVAALAKVLAAESGRDITVATLAHDGLKSLTGKDLPADPKEWEAVVQAGAVVK